jgi:hypothetical protein
VYLLRDYPHTVEEASLIEEEGWVLRTKLKTALKEIWLVAGVQTVDRVKDMERVYKVKPTLFVYYSGEPYFYSLPNMMADLSYSLLRCLWCKDSKEVLLGGRYVASLRRLRQGWEGRPHGHGQTRHGQVHGGGDRVGGDGCE